MDKTTNSNNNRTHEQRNNAKTINNSNTNSNNVKEVDGLITNNSCINLTTNIIIALGNATIIFRSIMAKEKETQKNKSDMKE